MINDSQYHSRSRIILIIFLGIGLVFLLRLFYIQIIDPNYKIFAENNSIRREVIFPPRGIIYDRKGKIMVRNETFYDVMVVPAKTENFDTSILCKTLELDEVEFKLNFQKLLGGNKFLPAAVVRQITQTQYGKFQERLFDFRGFFIQPRMARTYPIASASHLIGYLGEVNDDDIAANDYYKLGDFTGKSGLEKSYEKELRGTKGERKILVDVLNREQGRYLNGEQDVNSVAGKDLHTGIDLEFQQYAEKLMAGKRGSVVAIEPSTGEIIALVSTPDYDLNVLQGRNRAKNYRRLLLDPDKPLFNRAISAMYPPGSTLKPVEAILGLNDGIITKETVFNCPGGYRISASHTVGCHSPGSFNLHNGLKMSCNTYYCNVFKLMVDQGIYKNSAKGLDHWGDGLKLFGLGVKTGIDIPNERKGILPSSKLYNKYYGENRWHSSTIISLGIGQAEISITPLQLAIEAATIANRGYYIEPHIVNGVGIKDSVNKLPIKKISTGIPIEYFDFTAYAMQDVVEHGTAYFAKIPGIHFAGKTGTAENPHGDDHSIFIAFAPVDTPKIAFAIVIENAGFGGTWAAPMGSLLVEKYLTGKVIRPQWEQWILSNQYIKKAASKRKAQRAKDSINVLKRKGLLSPDFDENDKKDLHKEKSKNNKSPVQEAKIDYQAIEPKKRYLITKYKT